MVQQCVMSVSNNIIAVRQKMSLHGALGVCECCGCTGPLVLHHWTDEYNCLQLRAVCVSCNRSLKPVVDGNIQSWTDQTHQIHKCVCLRCEHTWSSALAKVCQCPNCKSPYWDKPYSRPDIIKKRSY